MGQCIAASDNCGGRFLESERWSHNFLAMSQQKRKGSLDNTPTKVKDRKIETKTETSFEDVFILSQSLKRLPFLEDSWSGMKQVQWALRMLSNNHPGLNLEKDLFDVIRKHQDYLYTTFVVSSYDLSGKHKNSNLWIKFTLGGVFYVHLQENSRCKRKIEANIDDTNGTLVLMEDRGKFIELQGVKVESTISNGALRLYHDDPAKPDPDGQHFIPYGQNNICTVVDMKLTVQ